MSTTSKALILSVAPWLVAAGALAAVAIQSSNVSSLEQRVAVLEATGETRPAPAVTELRTEVVGRPAPAAPEDDDRVAALLARVDALERKQATMPVVRPHAVGEGAAPEAVADDVAALRADVDTLLTGDNFDSDDTKKKLMGIVEEAVAARRQKFEQAREEATRQRVLDLAAELGLDEKRAASLSDLAVELRGTRRDVMDRVRSGELDMREARAEAQARQETIRTQVKDLLTDAQYTRFEEEFPERGGGRWGRGGGGGDWRGGPPDGGGR
ncbi:MAG: hypothetical protein H6745_03460 [Deltaproteobacteria bacterium]|nr:hypothetical protein [Deltaproteobacteria bacterium]